MGRRGGPRPPARSPGRRSHQPWPGPGVGRVGGRVWCEREPPGPSTGPSARSGSPGGDRALADEGVLTVERNPAWIGHSCPRCHRLGERFSASTTNPANRARFACGHCGWAGDAEVVAALNLHYKWDRTFAYPTAAEVAAWKRVERPKTLPGGRAAAASSPPLGDGARSNGADATAMLRGEEVAA